MAKLTMPVLDRMKWDLMCQFSSGNDSAYKLTRETLRNMDRLYETMRLLEPDDGGECRSVWIRIPRGNISEFGDFNDYLEQDEVENIGDFVRLWKTQFPSNYEWHLISTVEVYNGYKAIFIDDDMVLHQGPFVKETYWERDYAEELSGMISIIEESLCMIGKGEYADFLNDRLPYTKRSGKILRKDLFDLYPSLRREFFKGVSPGDLDRFRKFLQSPWDHEILNDRITDMTAGMFFRLCDVFYRVNKYPGKGLVPAERYRMNGYDFHSEMLDLDSESAEAFSTWCGERYHDGHPFRINKGGSFTVVELIPARDSAGYYLHLSGPADCSVMEVLRFYVSLRDMGVPVELEYAESFAERIDERDLIGIIPDYLWPYSFRWHISEGIFWRIHLPKRHRKRAIGKVLWDPICSADARLAKAHGDESTGNPP